MTPGRGPLGRKRVTRAEIVVTAGFLLASIGIFVAIAVLSYKWLWVDSGEQQSKLPPVAAVSGEQIVFDYSNDACTLNDLPDSPARAFRDADGQVHLIASHYVTRAMVGPSLDEVRHSCDRVMVSHRDPDPARFDDREWLTAPYTTDGRTVHALVHNEYQGNTHPGMCPSGEYLKCWYNAITLARSTDGGRTFLHAPAPSHLVAAVPYPYEADVGPFGLFQPSNIVHREEDGHYYAMIRATAHEAQRAGTCVMRTPRLGDPGAWRGWDGRAWTVRFVNPYRFDGGPDGHLCAPVSYPEIAAMVQSLTYNTYLDKYLLVSPAGQIVPGRREVVHGFYYSTSDNLIDWSPRKLLKEVVLRQQYQCDGPDPMDYPSLIDPDSTSRNFETTGRRPWLYFMRFNPEDCRLGLDRDLIRVRVRFDR